jgi:GNAT superfamily N-acetyltransferase
MDVTVVEALDESQIDQLVALYRNEFWCKHRQRAGGVKMLIHSDVVIGVVDVSNNLLGFARVLSDFTYKAIIFDVIVHPDWRDRGIGALLMNTVINHPGLKDIEHFDLNCLPEMHAFYKRWGFTAEVGELSFMRRFNREF